MKNGDGETIEIDLDEIRRDHDEWKGVIGTVFSVESMTTTTRSEFEKIPAKYLAIAQAIGADKVSREQESQNDLFRFFGGG